MEKYITDSLGVGITLPSSSPLRGDFVFVKKGQDGQDLL